MKEIGKKIKDARRKKKISQAKMAEEVGCSFATVLALEKGRNTGTSILSKVCDKLELEITVEEKQN